jgi:hypothetical protein
MANIVMGVGTSHTPMLTLGSDEWAHRAADDLRNQKLNRSDGRWISYDALLAEVGPRYTRARSNRRRWRRPHNAARPRSIG